MAGSPSRSIPRSGSAPARKGKTAANRRAKPSLLGRVIARPGVIVAGATFAAVMTGIIVNAVLFQKGHHPSPLFGQTQASKVEPPTHLMAPPLVPVPISRQVLEEPAASLPAMDTPAATPPPAPLPLHPTQMTSKPVKHTPVPTRKPATGSAHRDPIGQLLGKVQ